MNILFAAAECTPFVKVGGLADVVGTLPPSLDRLGHDVRVILPHHGLIDDQAFGIKPLTTFDLDWIDGVTTVEVSHLTNGKITTYFLRGWPYFSPDEDFIYHQDEGIDVGRFLFFAKAALEWSKRLTHQSGWMPDLVHVHDWHTAMIPYLLRRVYERAPVLGGAATLFTIHNIRYQGWGVGWHLAQAGIHPVDHTLLHTIDKADNSLAIGLAYSTMLSTVSPRYREELVSPEGGMGLDGLLHARLMRTRGILNGIDVERWNPMNVDPPFDKDTLESKAHSKATIQRELGLPVRPDVPVAAAITRLVDQKGPEILAETMTHMLYHAEMQFILLGSGHSHYERQMAAIGEAFPQKASINLRFDETLAERIYAGADMFMMPSLFEPCGIGQMIAMRYGALPVVRGVGGLADTVHPDVGFVFHGFNAEELKQALSNALHLYYNDKKAWRQRQQIAMQMDFSWERSVQEYIELYEETIRTHQRYRQISR